MCIALVSVKKLHSRLRRDSNPWPPSLPNDDWPARIQYSSEFHDICKLMKFLRRVINNWFHFALHQRVYSTAYSVVSECLWNSFTGDSGGIRTHDLLLTSISLKLYVLKTKFSCNLCLLLCGVDCPFIKTAKTCPTLLGMFKIHSHVADNFILVIEIMLIFSLNNHQLCTLW